MAAALPADQLRLYWCPDDGAPEPRRRRVDRLLRGALAPLLGLPPAAVEFSREARGRPFLRAAGAPDFNLSDTRGGTLIALCRQGRVGVDLERLDRQLPVARLAQRWFGDEEARALAALDPESARRAFLRLWTAKEASCKATGTGIFGYLGQWRFAVAEAQPRLSTLPEAAGAAARWWFQRLSPSPEHTAVIAVRDAAALQVSAYRLAL